MSTKLNLDNLVQAFMPIVAAKPDFTYPHQEDSDDMRCQCVEMLADPDDMDRDNPEEYYDYSDCQWHFDDDNTCRYVKPNGDAACIVGEYFVNSLGLHQVGRYEKQMPSVILERYGYKVDTKAARFLNTIQQQQDQGWSWTEAYEQAVQEAEGAPAAVQDV